jgi:hypothetical protein
LDWQEMRDIRDYGDFTRRYPWTVRPELCGGAVTTEEDWAGGYGGCVTTMRSSWPRLAGGGCGRARIPTWSSRACWPPFDDDAASYAPLRAYRGDVLLYAGDVPGLDGVRGATGTARFHRELALNWTPAEQAALPNWPGWATASSPTGGTPCAARWRNGTVARDAGGTSRRAR